MPILFLMKTSQEALQRAPNCLQCRYFRVTWEAAFPRACSMFGVKSKRLPSLLVFSSTGKHCPSFEKRVKVG